MKEFIEKLIERLEEISAENTCSDCPYKSRCDEVQKQVNDETTDLCGATIKSLAISIINQLADEYKPKTQADKIRSMSDEELAELFTKLAWNSEVQTTPLKYLDWLQSEAE